MKKVVMLISNFEIGGAQIMVCELISKISKFNVSVICTGRKINNELERRVESMVKVKYLNCDNRISISDILKVVKAIQKERPDIVHSHMGAAIFGIIWSYISNKNNIITVHSKPERAFSKKTEKLIRHGIKRANTYLVAVSVENKCLCEEYYGTDIKYINNGIDVSRFYKKTHEGFTFINVARQDENKNQRIIINCFSRLCDEFDNLSLLMLGDGPLHDELKATADSYGLGHKIIFTGNVGNVEDYYSISDAFVLSSRSEALPLCVIEAMASGLPIISTKVGGIIDVVQDNGILFNVDDESGLYDAMRTLIVNSEETLFKGEESKKMSERFSSENMARKYEDLYLNLI